MKFWKYILTLAVLTFGAVSCVEEVPYEQGEPDLDGCYGVYFPVQDATGAHTYDPSMDRTVSFTVARTNSTGDITVPVEVTSSVDGVFSVGELKFVDGQSETTLKVDFPTAETGITYNLSLAVTDPQYASKYNDGTSFVDFSVLIVTWEYFLNPKTGEKAKFTFNQGWWGEVHTGYIKYYDVNGVRTCVTETDPVTYDDGSVGYGFWGTGAAAGEGEITFTWYTNVFDVNGYQAVGLPVTDVGPNPSYDGAMIQAFDYYAYWTVLNPQAALQGVDFPTFVQKYSGNYPVSIYDGNGGFQFFIEYYYMMGLGGWQIDDYDVVLLADGFTRVDYSLAVEDDYTVAGTHPVYFTAGPDVASVKYVVSEGGLNAVQIEGVVAGIVDETAENVAEMTEFNVDAETGEKFAAVGVTLDKSGQYTVVAVAYDAEGNVQNNASVVIDYVAADDDSFDVAVNVIAEPTPSRYVSEGHTTFNSFSFTVYGGTELTDVKMNIFKTADVEKNGAAAVVAAVRAGSSVSEDILASINTTAGFTTLATGLADGTSYTVVVWGTNGYQTVTAAAEFATEKNPEVFKSLGMAQYTDDFLVGLFNGMENLTYEVEIQESVENPGKYRLVNPYGAAFPYNEPGDYDDTQDYYMVINAQDPEGVYIPLQGVGCDWGYGEWTVYSMAANYLDAGNSLEDIKEAGFCGTLKDGVITFPLQSLLITADGLGGSYYYANTSGAFKVVLPGAASEDTPAETTSVAADRSTVKSDAKSFADYSRFIPIEREASTVSFSQENISFVKKETGRNIAPAQMSKMTLN